MSDLKYPDLMVDLETTGLQPNRSAVIQIAAVRFNLAERTVSNDWFDRCLKIPKTTRFWDESTRTWWMGPNRAVFDKIIERGEEPAIVMKDFFDWVTLNSYTNTRFWSKPTTFDYPFVQSYLADYGQPMPFSFREATDQNSFLRGLYWPDPVDRNIDPEFKGDAHNAIVDCLNQINLLFAHCDHIEKAATYDIIEG